MSSVCLFTGGGPRGYPPTMGAPPGVQPQLGGAPGGPPQTGGGAPRGYPHQPKIEKKNGQCFGQKMHAILDTKWTKIWTKILETFGGWGGAGGTPLAVTQEDCLVTN